MIRALRWLCQNRPSGSAFIRQGERACRVTLRVDGRKITRRKGGSTNSFALDTKKFVAFGAGMPEEIARLLNVADANFQAQHDPPFHLASSPGEVARQLNQVVSLGAIDAALRGVGARVRRSSAAVDVNRQRLSVNRERLRQLRWVPDHLDNLDNLVKLDQGLDAARRRTIALRDLLAGMESIEHRRDRLSRTIQDGRAAVAAGERLLGSSNRVRGLAGLLGELEDLSREARRGEGRFTVLKLRLDRVTICPACGRPTR